MKKVILFMAVLFTVSLTVKADPAKKVNLAYASDTLKIEAQHRVRDIKTHYIDQIIVKVNDKEFKKLTFKQQTNNNAQVTFVVIPKLTKGTVIKVDTRCNEFGSKSGKLTL
jgi:hypothetical protein